MTTRPGVEPYHLEAVRRAVSAMRRQPELPHSLSSLARAAMLSPSHFHRTFREITSTTPARFLAAVRMTVAKRLLVDTDLSVTAVCSRVGYTSLGTFTTQFTRLVGLSPSQYGREVTRIGDHCIESYVDRYEGTLGPGVRGIVLGRVRVPAVLVVGLFSAGLPQGLPAAAASRRCATAEAQEVCVNVSTDGEYHVLAQCVDATATIRRALAAGEDVGADTAPLPVRGGTAGRPFRVVLRPVRPVDPPVVLAVPLLMALNCCTT